MSLCYDKNNYFYLVCRFGVHYELPLLIQSLIMTVTMLIMMHICVTVKKESTPTTIHRSIWGKTLLYVVLCMVHVHVHVMRVPYL